MRGSGWAGLLAASVCLGSQLAHAECTKDLDCEGELICEDAKCTEAPPPSPLVSPALPRARPEERVERSERPERPPRRGKRFKRPGLLPVGILIAGGGVGVLIYGVFSTQCRTTPCDTSHDLPAFALITLAMEGLAVPLIVMGAKREPVPTVAVTPWLAPRQGGVQLQLRL
jgi:hypothetical protein